MTSPNESFRILVADDDSLSTMILSRNLEAIGHEVVIAVDGESAWELIRSEPFRLVISDWMMPGVSGIELCRRVRARSDGSPYTYFILLTARSEQDDKLEAYDAGADDFLAKPFDRRELLARISAAQRILAMQADLSRRSVQVDPCDTSSQRREGGSASCVGTSRTAVSQSPHRILRNLLHGGELQRDRRAPKKQKIILASHLANSRC